MNKYSPTAATPSYKSILVNSASSTVAAGPIRQSQKCDGVTNKFVHILYGHVHLRKALSMATNFGLRMCTKGDWCKKIVACEACAIGKARKIGVNIHGTSTHIRATAPNKFVYLDISTIRDAGGTSVYNGVWVGIIDEYSGVATTLFVASRHAMVEAVCELFSDWRMKGHQIDILRCDNVGENELLMTRSKSSVWQLGITFQFTSAHTPQNNAMIEKFIDTIYNRARSTMTYANIPGNIKHIVCKHLILHLANLFNLEPVTKNGIKNGGVFPSQSLSIICTHWERVSLSLPKI